MPGLEFWQSRMGHRLFESTLPELVKQLTRLNDLLERFVRTVERDVEAASTPVPPEPPR